MLSVSICLLGVCFVLAAVGPAPRRTPPGERFTYLALLGAGLAMYCASALLPMVGLWMESMVGGTLATAVILFCMWLARSPLSRERRPRDEHEEGGGGGPKVPRTDPPEPPRPRGAPHPDGPPLDWGAFDDVRAGWDRPARDRELVGV